MNMLQTSFDSELTHEALEQRVHRFSQELSTQGINNLRGLIHNDNGSPLGSAVILPFYEPTRNIPWMVICTWTHAYKSIFTAEWHLQRATFTDASVITLSNLGVQHNVPIHLK
jgi:hypothetical protein